MTREPTTAADYAALEAADEARHTPNAKSIPAHQHSFALDGDCLRCYCGETVTWDEAEP